MGSGQFYLEGTPGGYSSHVAWWTGCALCVLIAVIDLKVPFANFSVLLAVPLVIMIAWASRSVHIWRMVALFALLNYCIYLLKYLVIYPDLGVDVWSFRVFNRSFIVLSLVLLGMAEQAWIFWQRERTLLQSTDRREEDDINAMTGTMACLGLGLIVLIADCFLPANYNASILYLGPLYLASWFRKSRMLWTVSAVFMASTIAAFFIGPESTDKGTEHWQMFNRGLVLLALAGVSAILHLRIRSADDLLEK